MRRRHPVKSKFEDLFSLLPFCILTRGLDENFLLIPFIRERPFGTSISSTSISALSTNGTPARRAPRQPFAPYQITFKDRPDTTKDPDIPFQFLNSVM